MKQHIQHISLVLYLVCALVISGVLGDYNTSYEDNFDKFNNQKTMPYRTEAATFVRNNTLYSVGGRTRDGIPMSLFDAFYLDANTGQLVHTKVEYNQMDFYQFTTAVAGCAAVLLPDNNRVLFFGGDRPPPSSWSPAQSGDMHVVQFDFTTETWTVLENANSTETVPRNTESLTATLASNGKIYIYGGTYTSANTTDNITISTTMSVYDPEINHFSSIPVPRNATTALAGVPTALSDGRIVYFKNTQYPNVYPAKLLVAIFDTNTNETSVFDLGDSETTLDYVKEFTYGFLGPDQQTIYFFGGVYNYGKRVKAHNTLAALNVDERTWSYPQVNTTNIYPRRRYDFVAGFLNSSYLLVGLGRSEYNWFTQFDVLRISDDADFNSTTYEWVSNIYDKDVNVDQGKSGLSGGAIAGIVIGAVVAVIIALIIWKCFGGLGATASSLYTALVWSPRAGEPRWTELTHLLSTFVLTFLFIAYMTYHIIMVVQSPIATTTLTKPVTEVQFPDVRVCTAPDEVYALIHNTQTLVAQLQSDKVTEEDFSRLTDTYELQLDQHYPYTITSPDGRTKCWLFHPSEEFKIGSDQESSNSRIKLFFGGDERRDSNNTRIQIEIYPPGRDPNMVIRYPTLNGQTLSQEEVEQWRKGDLEGVQAPNKYTVDYNSYTTISYQIEKHRYLTSNGWNNVGFLQEYNDILEISTSLQTMNGDSELSSTIDIYPVSMTEVTLQDQKVYTLLSALGAVGGLFSLLVTADGLLFGARPKSPWGVIQRFSISKARTSLLNNLYNAFGFLGRPIPYIDPVHERYADAKIHQQNDHLRQSPGGPLGLEKNDNDILHQPDMEDPPTQQEVQDLQRRLQLMESIFKAYYIDEEIFQNLRVAHNEAGDTEVSEAKPSFVSGAFNKIRRRRSTKMIPLPIHNSSSSDEEPMNESPTDNVSLAHR
ncbi:hypothetical protein BJV82DRAFT_672280 [Fennellomyces sp. T-0311]|nr:hypothetical protein BJV82DRAFT_672280 [Fennellomyces sp. T-0311]